MVISRARKDVDGVQRDAVQCSAVVCAVRRSRQMFMLIWQKGRERRWGVITTFPQVSVGCIVHSNPP